MKAIIYAGIGLFSVATAYGLADYYSSQKKGTLDKLYAEEEIPVTPVAEKTTTVLPVKNIETVPVANKTVTTKVKSTKKVKRPANKRIRLENFSRARIPEQVTDEKIKEVPVKKQEEIIPVKIMVAPAEKIDIKAEPERKISLDKFSRAPLRKPVKPVKQITVKN